MDRRRFLRASLAGGSGLLLMGHSPYRQWYVFRANHLIVVASQADPGAFPIAQRLAGVLAARLPDTRALAAEARTSLDVVKLLRSHQLPLALLAPDDAAAAATGQGRFRDEASVPLRALGVFGSFVLVALDDFSRDTAHRVAGALARLADGDAPPIPLHPGALDSREGRAPPPPR